MTDTFKVGGPVALIMEYQPSPEARKEARRICFVSFFDENEEPVQTITNMAMACIENDFKNDAGAIAVHSISKEMNEAVMTWCVHFMDATAHHVEAYMKGEWTPTPRDD